MRSVASTEIEEAEDLFQLLKRKSFAAELRVVVNESGFQLGEVTVPEVEYERACNIVEAWDAERQDAYIQIIRLPCPQCGSGHVGLVARDTGGYTFHCRHCGRDYEPKHIDT